MEHGTPVTIPEKLILPSARLIKFSDFKTEKEVAFFSKGYLCNSHRTVNWLPLEHWLADSDDNDVIIVNQEFGDTVGMASIGTNLNGNYLKASFKFDPGILEAIQSLYPGSPGLFVSPVAEVESHFSKAANSTVSDLNSTLLRISSVVISILPLRV